MVRHFFLTAFSIIAAVTAFTLYADAPHVELLSTPVADTEVLQATISNRSLAPIEEARLVVRVENADGLLLRAFLLPERVSLAPSMSRSLEVRVPGLDLREDETVHLVGYPAGTFDARGPESLDPRIRELRERLRANVADPSQSREETLERLDAFRQEVVGRCQVVCVHPGA